MILRGYRPCCCGQASCNRCNCEALIFAGRALHEDAWHRCLSATHGTERIIKPQRDGLNMMLKCTPFSDCSISSGGKKRLACDARPPPATPDAVRVTIPAPAGKRDHAFGAHHPIQLAECRDKLPHHCTARLLHARSNVAVLTAGIRYLPPDNGLRHPSGVLNKHWRREI